MKSLLERRALLKRFWGAKARKGRGGVGGGGVAQVEGDSNRHPIAIQSRSNRPNSTTPTRIVASNCPLSQILCTYFIPNEQPHLGLACSNHSNHMHPRPRTSLLPPPGISSICNLHPADSFASQQPPKRASPQKARPSHALSSLQPSRPITHLAWNSNPYDLIYPSIPSVFQFFPWFYSISPSFYSPFQSPQVQVGGRTRGGRTPPSPNCHLVHQPQNRSKSTTEATRIRWGRCLKIVHVFSHRLPRPPILTSFAMSNFAMLDSWLS